MAGFLMEISDREFKLMRQLIYDRFGINLTEQKRSLMVGRLQKLISSSGFKSFQEYYKHLTVDKSDKSLGELIDRISTNHTYFNREKDHFTYFTDTALPKVIARLKQQGRHDLRIWCAGCSSGEELYMLLMLMHEHLGSDYKQWDAGILATDISQQALNTAKAGIYSDDRVKNLPEKLKKKYFRRQGDGNWAVVDAIKQEAIIRRFNLMNNVFPFKKAFQIIFCRNVMIYFDRPTRETLVSKFHNLLEPDGYFFIGHSETLGRDQQQFKYIMPAAYQKNS